MRMNRMVALACLAALPAAAGTPHGLTCEYRTDPVGIDAATPRLSWKLPEDVKEQSAYEIEADGWRSGRVVSSRQLDVEWGGSALATGRRVQWRVRVWDGEGRASAWSAPARFTMGVMREADWKAEWLGRPKAPAQAFERRFVLKGPVRRATLFITAAGFYEAWLNGRRIGDKVLDPSPTQFDKRILYSTYLLDGDLQEGENVLRVLVGHGWYDVRAQADWNFNRAPWRDFPRMLAQLELEYEDGGRETVASDRAWTVASSPVLHDDIREGEIVRSHDACPDAGSGAKTAPAPAGARLVAEAHPATKVIAEMRPEKVVRLGDGSWMVCFPVNLAGWIRLRVSGQERDSVVAVRYDERVNDDLTPALPTWLYGRRVTPPPGKDVRKIDAHMHFPSSHRVLPDGGAFQTDRIICSGEDETYEPRFTYNGFRYVWISGWKGELRPEDVTGCVVATSFARTGRFESSDPVLNRLLDMVDRSYRSNFVVGFPTDCPHREKNGWTGDASMAGELAQYLYENTAGYEKWLADICDAQNGKGDIPGIVPTGGWGFRWGNGPGWDSALPVLSWHLYRYRGDRRILERTYPALVRYLAFTAERADEDSLVRHGLGDWCPVEKSRVPTTHLTSSCFWYQAQRIAALMADVLGKDEDAARFADGAERTKEGFNRRFYRGGGIYEEGLQTAEAMPLAFGLVPSAEMAAVRARLVEACERTDGHCDCGLFGTKYVFRELSEAGRTDLALRMIVNPTAPSFRAMADAGATTLWEHWSGRSSLNHIMFGDFAAWAYQYLAGVRLAASEGSCSAIPTGPCAFREFVLAPVAVEALDRVSAAVETPYGTVESAWRREGGRLAYDFRVPPGTTARVTPPWGGGTRTYGPGRWSVSQ